MTIGRGEVNHSDVGAGGAARASAASRTWISRIDILDDGEIVETFVPLTGRDEILYEVEPHAA